MAEAVSTGGETVSFPSEEYECKICYNNFDLDRHVPKLLGCSHTFCQDCLDTLHSREGRGWRIGCPVCRQRTPVPEYRVHNLPDDTAVTEALPLKKHKCVESDNRPGPTVCLVPSPNSDHSCLTWKQVAFTTCGVCLVFSFLSMVILLFLGLIFVHNFKNITSSVGPLCLVVASFLALFSLILSWLICVFRYQSETEANNFSQPQL